MNTIIGGAIVVNIIGTKLQMFTTKIFITIYALCHYSQNMWMCLLCGDNWVYKYRMKSNHWFLKPVKTLRFHVVPMSQPHFWKSVRMTLTLSKWGLRSPLGLPKLQSSIAGVKTPCLEAFFMSLERYWSLNVENGLAWTICSCIAQVMAKRKVGSQISNLTPDH